MATHDGRMIGIVSPKPVNQPRFAQFLEEISARPLPEKLHVLKEGF